MDETEKPTFTLETNTPFILENVYISSVQGIVLAMVFALVVAVAFHTLNFVIHFRERHPYKRKSNLQHSMTTALHVMSAILAYVMVYCVKTMNVWLLTSIVLGSGVGQLVIGPFVSIALEKKRLLHTGTDNEPLCDFLPEDTSSRNGYSSSPAATSRDESNDRLPSHTSKRSNVKTDLINLDDFIIQKGDYVNLTGYSKTSNSEDNTDLKSEYDSLNDDFTVDSKLLLYSHETRL